MIALKVAVIDKLEVEYAAQLEKNEKDALNSTAAAVEKERLRCLAIQEEIVNNINTQNSIDLQNQIVSNKTAEALLGTFS
jgi:hypothetical protein